MIKVLKRKRMRDWFAGQNKGEIAKPIMIFAFHKVIFQILSVIAVSKTSVKHHCSGL